MPNVHETPNHTEPTLLHSAQLAQIQSMITRTVQESLNDIATNAARAAVQAMSATPVSTSINEMRQNQDQLRVDEAPSSIALNSNVVLATPEALPQPQTNVSLPYGNAFHDVPASYIKQIQTGEFFELSKLLPKNLFATTNEQPVSLTLENSIIKVKTSTQSVTNITDIEQWTTAFTTYMSVFTHEFPNRAQELLQYMTIIRHAAQCHKGVGWCIYDVKFRRKAALNRALSWAEIDQQLWLMIFTVPPATLKEEFPLFKLGPQQNAFPGAEQGGICRDFNRTGACRRSPCKYRHLCNRCEGQHSGVKCPTHGRNREQPDKEHQSSSKHSSNYKK